MIVWKKALFRVLAVLALSVLAACGEDSQSRQITIDPESDLSIESQIGPITSLELGVIDMKLAEKGAESFNLRCSACHKLDTKLLGPPLGGILAIRSPVYVMNMIMNPTDMLSLHPVAKAQLVEYVVPMADLGVSEDDARAILEYLRREAALESGTS